MVLWVGDQMKWVATVTGGGTKDYVEMLELDGHAVFVVSVGPVSSNWERAIEVYYQLKGGQVKLW